MANFSPRRTRRDNGGFPLVLPTFLNRLSRATGWDGEIEQFVRGDTVVPGSAKSQWRTGDPGRFSVDYLWAGILSKFDDGETSEAKESKAWERFKEAEEQCKEANLRLAYDRSQVHHREPTELQALIEGARRKIARLLGPLKWNEAAEGFSFTSGASTRLSRRMGDPAYKFSGIPESTYSNLDLATAAICTVPSWERRLRLQGDAGLVNIRDHNRVITVPKNYKTNRVIAVEPCMNMYVQKGLASVIRKRLRKVGIDLRSQRTNQDLAHLGSVTDAYATIDMSMASDTVSLEIVRLLLPPDWCQALEMCRTATGVLPSGEKVLYRKFSSMGNGYTFELETLIFWSLAASVCASYGVSERLIAVYGDDVIIPSSVAHRFTELLRFCGFATNEDKTFIDGPFRESCGKHYLSGFDVTPFYIKEKPDSLLKLFLLHNQLYRWCVRNKWNPVWDRGEMQSLLAWLRSLAPSPWRRPRIPDGIGDGAFIGTFDECRPRSANTFKPGKVGKRDGWEGFLVDVLADVSEQATFTDYGFGIPRKGGVKVVPRLKAPDTSGFLLKLLSREATPWLVHLVDDASEGGISLTPRVREVTTLVPQWLGEEINLFNILT